MGHLERNRRLPPAFFRCPTVLPAADTSPLPKIRCECRKSALTQYEQTGRSWSFTGPATRRPACFEGIPFFYRSLR